MKKRLLIILIAASFIFSGAAFSISGDEISFYVSPRGSDTGNGSKASPFKTIERAKEAVSEINSSQSADINVYLMGGTHFLEKPLEFSQANGGKNGFFVNYKNYGNEKPVISGGKRIEGWTEDEESGLWQAALDLGENYALSLDINGVPAKRAESKTAGRFLRGYYDAEDTDSDLDGFYTSSKDLPKTYKNQSDIQVQLAYMWRTYIYNIDEIITNPENAEESIVKVSRQIQLEEEDLNSQIALMEENGGAAKWGYTVINAFEELDEPGEFYYDRSFKTIYYMPRENENMKSAEVIVPVLEKLVDIRGESTTKKVKNISFSGITFSHSSWQDLARYGFHTGQTQDFYAQPEMLKYEEFVGKFFVPASIQLNMTDGISFKNNTFRAIDSVAIGLYQGAYNTEIDGNKFYDLSDSAVTVGLPNQAYESTVVDGCNLAENKKVMEYPERSLTHEKRYYQSFLPEAAVQPNKNFGWHSEYIKGERSWLQVDLGEAFEIDRIEIDARQDTDQKGTRRLFEVIASTDDPEFNEGSYDVLGSLSWDGGETEVYKHKGTWSKDVSSSKKYRYVRVRKTYSEIFYINELRVINKSMEFSPKYQLSRHTEVTNNVITRTSQRNWGAPGIHTYFTEDALISNNDISDLPYSGICAGWGWIHYLDMTTCREIKIKNNRIKNVMKKMVDGGGIYTLGPQPDSEISGNFISNMPNAISGVYLDSGSNFFTVKDNVFEDVVFTTTGGSGDYASLVRENYFYDNFTSAPNGSRANLQSPSTNGTLVEAEVFADGNYPDGAIKIIKNAGLNEKWQHLLNEIPEKAFADRVWEKYDNVINVTNYGSMNDNRLLYWHLRYFVERAKEHLSFAKENTGDGYLKYPQSAVAAFEEKLSEIDAYEQARRSEVNSIKLSEQLILNRAEVLAKRDELKAAAQALSESLNLRSVSELVSLSEESGESSKLKLLAKEAAKASQSKNQDLVRCLRLEMERELAKEKGFTKTEVINVAKNKPVITEYDRNQDSYPGNEIVDDDLRSSSFWFGYAEGQKPSAAIDLQRRYKVEKIKIFDRMDVVTPCIGQFEIWGANKEDFSDAKLLFELNDNNAFEQNGDYTITFDEKPIVRFIKYQAKMSAATYIREIQVFAKVTMTERTQNLSTITHKTYSGYEGVKAVDDNFDTAYATSAYSGEYSAFTVDLGSSTNVDVLEIYPRKAMTSQTIDGNFKIYGSQTAINDFSVIPDGSSQNYAQMTEEDFEKLGFDTLVDMSYANQKYTLSDGSVYEPYPLWDNTNKANFGCFRTTLDREKAYRYFTHRKTSANMQAQFSEFKLYQLNPDLYEADASTTTVYLGFSENMKEESLSKEKLKIFDASGDEVSYSNILVSGNIVALENADLKNGELYTVFAENSIQNSFGVELKEDKYLNFYALDHEMTVTFTDENGNVIDEPSSKKGYYAQLLYKNNKPGTDSIILVTALYTDNKKLISLEMDTKDVEFLETERFSSGMIMPEDMSDKYVKVFVWDLNKLMPLWMKGETQ